MEREPASLLSFGTYWRTRPWLRLAAAFGLGYLLLLMYGILPSAYALWQRRAALGAQEAQLEQARTLAAAERRTRARIRRLETTVERLRNADPAGGGPEVILAALSRAARRAGLRLTALKRDEAITREGHLAWPLHIRAEGRYPQAGAFIDALERLSALLVIEQVELTASGMNRAHLILKMDLIRYQLNREQKSP